MLNVVNKEYPNQAQIYAEFMLYLHKGAPGPGLAPGQKPKPVASVVLYKFSHCTQSMTMIGIWTKKNG